MNRGKLAISALAAGAALMYFSDPDRGKRGRVLVRDKAAKAWNRSPLSLRKVSRISSTALKAPCTDLLPR